MIAWSVPLVTAGPLALIAYALALLVAGPAADPLIAVALGATLVLLLALVHFAGRVAAPPSARRSSPPRPVSG